jgi:hypothetical protein
MNMSVEAANVSPPLYKLFTQTCIDDTGLRFDIILDQRKGIIPVPFDLLPGIRLVLQQQEAPAQYIAVQVLRFSDKCLPGGNFLIGGLSFFSIWMAFSSHTAGVFIQSQTASILICILICFH